MVWTVSNRADPVAVALADRHYNRQKVGTPQFMPAGSCIVFTAYGGRAVWGTSWPLAEYTKHAWAGAWINSIFRNESEGIAHEMILQAIAATRWLYGEPPALGMVTFIDPNKVRPTMVHGQKVWGWTYRKAGFVEVGKTKVNEYLAFQLLPEAMPEPEPPREAQLALF